ncbi:hypothetical protein GCM10020000_31370 [Streptomyces olivoverticillatus]
MLGGNGSHADAVQRVDDAASFYSSMNVLYLLSFLATAILWVIWFRRARLNAELFAPGTQRFGSGWAVGAWVTPVVSFWFPKQMANDIYRASAPAGPQSAPPRACSTAGGCCGTRRPWSASSARCRSGSWR